MTDKSQNMYNEPHLGARTANFVPLTPLSFLSRAAAVYPDKIAVIHGDRHYAYSEFHARCRRLANALHRRGIGMGDTVSVLAPNVPALLEAHYGVPMAGAVLNAVNFRLNPQNISFILEHANSKLLIVDREFSSVADAALNGTRQRPVVIDIDDPSVPSGRAIGEMEYEEFLTTGDPTSPGYVLADELDAITLNYTSGTTGNPKGAVYSHRGAFLNSVGNVMALGFSLSTVYLWTLPMFHCNGWSHTWAVTAGAGTHVCLRRPEPLLIFAGIERHHVTHLSAAPIVLNMLVHAPDNIKRPSSSPVQIATGGAAPPSSVIANMEQMGFRITHLYGLTETVGPATLCAWQEQWNSLGLEERAVKMSHQGVPHPMFADARVLDPQTMQDIPADGKSLGELMLRSNTVMKGYLKNPNATEEALSDGYLHTGDLAVMHPDGYLELKDRSKDIIIFCGENISSLEIEEALFKHPAVMEAAVVARPDEKWGETPCAFVTLKPGVSATAKELIGFCRDQIGLFKAPSKVVFGPLPKTATGKIQKFILREQARTL